MQGIIPEWKRTSLTLSSDQPVKLSLKDRIKQKLKSKIVQTEAAKQILMSKEYKEYQDFRSEMK
jgi:hypothetical protein